MTKFVEFLIQAKHRLIQRSRGSGSQLPGEESAWRNHQIDQCLAQCKDECQFHLSYLTESEQSALYQEVQDSPTPTGPTDLFEQFQSSFMDWSPLHQAYPLFQTIQECSDELIYLGLSQDQAYDQSLAILQQLRHA